MDQLNEACIQTGAARSGHPRRPSGLPPHVPVGLMADSPTSSQLTCRRRAAPLALPGVWGLVHEQSNIRARVAAPSEAVPQGRGDQERHFNPVSLGLALVVARLLQNRAGSPSRGYQTQVPLQALPLHRSHNKVRTSLHRRHDWLCLRKADQLRNEHLLEPSFLLL